MKKFLVKIETLFLLLGFLALCLHVAYKIYIGEGTHQYSNFFGLKFNYLGVAVLILVTPFAFVVGRAIEWMASRHEREFLKKYNRDSNK